LRGPAGRRPHRPPPRAPDPASDPATPPPRIPPECLSSLAGMNDRAAMMGLCVDRAGFRRGARLAEFITEWEMCVRAHAGPIGIEEFAHWWKDSPRTAYRRLKDFRAVFPELGAHGTPQDLMRPLLARLAAGELPDEIPGLAIAT
jgi:hypothetical protein